MNGNNLLNAPLNVVAAGLDIFSNDLEKENVPVIQLDWRPPAHSSKKLNEALKRIIPRRAEIDLANRQAVEKILNAQPVWTDVGLAIDVIPGFTKRTITHAGPPVKWEKMCGPMRGSVMGAIIYEGYAKNGEEAAELAASGAFDFVPCHHLHSVAPMTGVFSANMPVIVVENKENGNKAYSIFNTEGKGRPFSFGAYGEDTQEMLAYLRDIVAPALKAAVHSAGGIDLKAITAQALHMGDDCHNRLIAATGQLWKTLVVHLAKCRVEHKVLEQLAATMYYNNWFFLNFSMAACKATMDAAQGIPMSTIVTAMARNGTEVGIQVSGLPGQWFTTKAPYIKGVYYPGYTSEDANPDIGDSSITETCGIGAFAMAAALSMTQLVGGTVQDAINITKLMGTITAARSKAYTIPLLNFQGTPTGIDILKVVETGTIPYINTGIANKKAGIGIIGAGIVRMPFEVFEEAMLAMDYL
jgi:hypothetical protein